jgi:predicted metal-dependent HD superfamily phosphohydrolase
MKGYLKIRKKILEILNSELSKKFYYHSMRHTLDVLKVINQYIAREKIKDHNAKLLRIGALIHDIGFTVSNVNHEEHGVIIANQLMQQYGFSKQDIKIVCGLIMATKIPQNPKNKLEEIICDADLDYLGRSDFYPISDRLYKELKANFFIDNKKDWNKAQIKFLELHSYRTDFAKKNRQPHKIQRINELKLLVD